MLKLPESLRIVSSVFNVFTSLVDDLRTILSIVGPVYVVSLVPLVFFLIRAFPICSKHKNLHRPSESLQALSSILTPTCVSWPREYAAFLEHSTCTKSKTIRYALSKLYTNICMGDVEIRDFHDLPNLLNGPLRTYGWNVCLGVDFSNRSAVFHWVVKSQALVSKHGSGFLGKQQADEWPLGVVLEAGDVDLRYVLSSASKSTGSSVCLDFIPYAELGSAIRTIQNSVRPGHTASFEFSAIAPKVPFLSDQYIFCSYPFMPRSYASTPQVSYRTSTPLLISIQKVVEMLASGTSTTMIETVSNMTVERAKVLQRLEKELATDSNLRSAAIRKWGVKGWREFRFIFAWEAALLQAGCLANWSITIRK